MSLNAEDVAYFGQLIHDQGNEITPEKDEYFIAILDYLHIMTDAQIAGIQIGELRYPPNAMHALKIEIILRLFASQNLIE